MKSRLASDYFRKYINQHYSDYEHIINKFTDLKGKQMSKGKHDKLNIGEVYFMIY